MAMHHFRGQSQLKPDFAHLIFKEVTQRFHQLECHLCGQAADVVMGLDQVSLTGGCRGGFNNIRIDRPLSQPDGVGTLHRHLIEDLNEKPTDDFALLFWINDTFKRAKKAVFGVYPDNPDANMPCKAGHYLITLAQSQQASIDEYAGKLLANSFMQQGPDDRRVHTSR